MMIFSALLKRGSWLILLMATHVAAQDLSLKVTPSTTTPAPDKPFTLDISVNYHQQDAAEKSHNTLLDIALVFYGEVKFDNQDIQCASPVALEPAQQRIRCSDLLVSADQPRKLSLTLIPADKSFRQISIEASLQSIEKERLTANNQWSNTLVIASKVISQSNQNIALGNNIAKIHTVDVNRDQHPDLVIGYANQQLPQIFINTGNGTFNLSPITLPGSPINSVSEILSGDIDGNGYLDLLFAYRSSQSQAGGIRHYEADSQYIFTLVSEKVILQGQDIRSAALADVTGDGIADLILGNHGSNLIIKNSGDTISQTSNDHFIVPGDGKTIAIRIGDLLSEDNGNEILFINADSNSVIRSSGIIGQLASDTPLSERYAAATSVDFNETRFKQVEDGLIFDIDQNGVPEAIGLASGSKSSETQRHGGLPQVQTGRGSTFFGHTSSHARQIISVDYDQDTVPDIYIQNADGSGLLYGSLNGQLMATGTTIAAGDGFSVVSSADLNNDQYPDLIIGSSQGEGIKVFLNPGDNNQALPSLDTMGRGQLAWAIVALLFTMVVFRMLVKRFS